MSLSDAAKPGSTGSTAGLPRPECLGSRGSESRLHDVKLKGQLFAANDPIKIKLAELPCEAKSAPTLIEIHYELETNGAPEIHQGYVSSDRLELQLSIKGKPGGGLFHLAP